MTPEPLPLAAAARRLRKPAGRPRTIGQAVQGAPSEPAKDAASAGVFAMSLLPRGLPMQATVRVRDQAKPVTTYPATAYSGIPVRALWRLIREGKLRPIRPPGVRRILLDRHDLDELLDEWKAPSR